MEGENAYVIDRMILCETEFQAATIVLNHLSLISYTILQNIII